MEFLAQCENMKIESFSSSEESTRELLIPSNHFKNWFFHSPHYNYVGSLGFPTPTAPTTFKPMAVSVVLENEGTKVRIIVWTRLGDSHDIFDLENSQKIKWEKSLPTVLKPFVIDLILRQRKDKSIQPEFHLEHVKDPTLKDQLLKYEGGDPLRPTSFSIGVLYSSEGQTTEEEAFNNFEGSPMWNDFLHFLGDKIELKGWKGFRGDLDVHSNSTGTHSIFRRWKGLDLMFHVSTLLPFDAEDRKQLHRKRRIGNDIAVIVFQEGGTYHPPIQSQFLHSYNVISPSYDSQLRPRYRFGVTTVEGVGEYGPSLKNEAYLPNNNFLDLLLTKVINGILTSLHHPALREKVWCRPKEYFLRDLVQKHVKSKTILSQVSN